MSDTFSFRAAQQPLRQRIDPRAFKAAVAASVLVLALGTFAHWVIGSERASEAGRVHTVSPAVQTVPGKGSAGSTDVSAIAPEDHQAQHAGRQALSAARRLFGRHGSFTDAGPAQLTAALPAYSFVDGPSPDPSIVSVASTGNAWAAAIHSATGTCFLIHLNAGGRVTYGTGGPCSGTAALGAAADSW